MIGVRLPTAFSASDRISPSSVHSEWAQIAVLRRQWRRSSEQLAVTYRDRQIAMELNCGSETVFSGFCNPRICVDGQPQHLRKDWEEVCWLSDSDVDKERDLQRLQEDIELEYNQRRDELLARASEKIRVIINEYAKLNGFGAIFLRNEAQTYVDLSLDITQAVTRIYNERYPAVVQSASQ